MDIILYLLTIIQYLYQMNCWLLNFFCRYIPLKQWAFDDSHSPKYQKYKVDDLPLITDFRQEWTYKELIPYFEKRYGKKIRPVRRRSECDIPEDCSCPRCQAPQLSLIHIIEIIKARIPKAPPRYIHQGAWTKE